MLSVLIILFSNVLFAAPPANQSTSCNLVCFCTHSGHASVHLYDCKTKEWYGRGLWAEGYGIDVEGPPVPRAGQPPPKSTGSGGGSSSGSSSGGVGPSSSSGSSSGSSGSGSISLGEFDGPGKVHDEGSSLLGLKCICFEITETEYNKTADYINNYPRWYRLGSQNCVDFVEAVANHLGKKIPPTNDWGVSLPWIFYDNLNKWKDGYNESGSFIAYGNNKSKFARYLSAPREEETVKQTAYTEDILRSPDVLFTRSIAKKPYLQATILLSHKNVVQGIPVTFSVDFTPKQDSLLWWDFGDGFRSFKPKPSYTYNTNGIYFVRMYYMDEFNTTRYATTKINVSKAKTVTLTNTPKVSLLDGTIVKMNKSDISLDAIKEMNDTFRTLPEPFSTLMYDDMVRIHIRVKGKPTEIFNLKTENGKLVDLTYLGSVDTTNENLLINNNELFIDCMKVTYTAYIITDEDTMEKIVNSKNPLQTLRSEWGIGIIYQGLTFKNWLTGLIISIFGF